MLLRALYITEGHYRGWKQESCAIAGKTARFCWKSWYVLYVDLFKFKTVSHDFHLCRTAFINKKLSYCRETAKSVSCASAHVCPGCLGLVYISDSSKCWNYTQYADFHGRCVGSVKGNFSSRVRIGRSSSYKVIGFGTNQKRVCDFYGPSW